MKVSFYMEDFESAYKRISCVIDKKAICPEWRALNVIAQNGRIYLRAENQIESVMTSIDGEVIESGDVFIDASNISNMLKIKGKVEFSFDGALKVTNGKKKSVIPAFESDYESVHIKGSFQDSSSYKVSARKLIDTLKLISPFVSPDNEMLNCFMLDFENDSIASCDGVSVASRTKFGFNDEKISDNKDEKKSIIVSPIIANSIGKIHSKKIPDTIMLTYVSRKSGGYIQIVGDDYIYHVLCKTGKYLDYRKFIASASEGCVEGEFNIDEMFEVSKEYLSLKGDKNVMVTICDVEQNNFRTAIHTSNYSTSDLIDATITCKNSWYSGFNPWHMRYAMEIFKTSNDETVDFCLNQKEGMNVTPILMQNDEWNVMVLPVRITPEYYSKVMNAIK